MVASCFIRAVNFLGDLRQSMQWYMFVDMQEIMIAGLLKRELLDGLTKNAFHIL